MSEFTSKSVEGVTGPVLHVVVVGFHHKRGCQVEYSYPPLIDGEPVDSHEVPEIWKNLPTLALPDGAHNYEQDTVYFHLPARENPKHTVYGISCYRQMDSESLIRRSEDVTRGTVQKSVCVLSTLPLYGLIQAKLSLITHAYFDEKDFSQVSLLQETYKNLNSSLCENLVKGSQVFLGLSAREFLLTFKHKALLLFKLVLLERKVLFFKGPVRELCSAILSLLSLFPGMIEQGFKEAASINHLKQFSSDMTLNNEHDCLEVRYETKPRNRSSCVNSVKANREDINSCNSSPMNGNVCDMTDGDLTSVGPVLPSVVADVHTSADLHPLSKKKHEKNNLNTKDSLSIVTDNKEQNSSDQLINNNESNNIANELESMLDIESREKVDLTKSKLQFCDGDDDNSDNSEINEDSENDDAEQHSRMTYLKNRLSGAFQSFTGSFGQEGPYENAQMSAEEEPHSPASIISLEIDDCGLPLSVFAKGALCLPYLSLAYLDLLSDINVRSFVFGATNVLFKQKKHLLDVIVEIDDGKVDILDPELKKQLHLTTEDLRFADFLVRHVCELDSSDLFLDGTAWEGGDEWLRAQFKWYLLSLLRSSQLDDGSKELEAFNQSFMSAWKTTHNYKMWLSGNHPGVLEVNPGHPFHGNLNMADMKLRLSHTMFSSERGRKINQAVSNTGRYVSQTGRVVGGALTNAKSAVSSWFSSFSTSPAANPPE